MVRTYVKQFFGTNEAVETAIRTFDKVLRMRYNVYGGRREYSGKNADGNYEVVMSYTADWMDSDRMAYLFPEYTIDGIVRTFHRRMWRMPDGDDWWEDVIKEADMCLYVGKESGRDRIVVTDGRVLLPDGSYTKAHISLPREEEDTGEDAGEDAGETKEDTES